MIKPRTVAAAAFMVAMLISGGVVLHKWQAKHPPRMMGGGGDRDMHDERDWRGGGGNWRAARDAERTAAIACIGGQLDAFRKNDYAKAITYQSRGLHAQFRSPQMFSAMIHRYYPEFAAPKKVEYGRAFTDHGGRMMAMAINLTGENGRKVSARYQLIQEKDGYRVLGVDAGR